MHTRQFARILSALIVAAAGTELVSRAQQTPTPPLTPDIPASFTRPLAGYDYVKRVEMIPMRDGVKLFTVILVPNGARNAPIVLTRTPYNAAGRAARTDAATLRATLGVGDDVFAGGDYIRVYQDVRGKYGSEGDYVMTRPLRGPLNSSNVDHSTDAWDTIDWLVKHTPESNGKVGMIGSSYEGFTVVMALVNPHPALKVAAPESPMVDGWMGDDWFHYGAFRQTNFDYFTGQTTARGSGGDIVRKAYDDYQNFLDAGSAGDFARAGGLEQLPWWRKVTEHPSYDQFWQAQALDSTMAAQPLTVPTLWLQGLWDQEDMWGAIHSYLATELKDRDNTRNFLVMGPWFHSQINREGFSLGPFRWAGDTTAEVRRDIIKPFFDQVLKGWSARCEDAAGVHLQHRREPLGSAGSLAPRVREGMRVHAKADLPDDERRPVVHDANEPVTGSDNNHNAVRRRHERTDRERGVRRLRLGSREAGAVRAATRPLR